MRTELGVVSPALALPLLTLLHHFSHASQEYEDDPDTQHPMEGEEGGEGFHKVRHHASARSYVSNYRPGYNYKKFWKPKELANFCNETFSSDPDDWICNPDGLLSPKQERNLNNWLTSKPIHDVISNPDTKCRMYFKLILIRELDPNFITRLQGYTKATPFLARKLAEGYIRQGENEHPLCCHTIVVLMTYHHGKVQYGIASCRLFKIQYCRILELFRKHAAALYKIDYFRYGLRNTWDELVTDFYRPKGCDGQYYDTMEEFRTGGKRPSATLHPLLFLPSLLLTASITFFSRTR